MTEPAPTTQPRPGQIVILNGTPRSGKSSIAAAIQERFEGVWMNLGVDGFKHMTPRRYQPGIGLRPGGERPDLEPLIVTLYQAMYEAIAAHSRAGLNVVVDVGHHDAYSVPRGILPHCATRLIGLPVLFVGVRCPLEVVMGRLVETWNFAYAEDGSIPGPIRRWYQAVHISAHYDLEVDTSRHSPEECATLVQERLREGPVPSTLHQLAAAAPAADASRFPKPPG